MDPPSGRGQRILTLDRLPAEVRFSGCEKGFGREVGQESEWIGVFLVVEAKPSFRQRQTRAGPPGAAIQPTRLPIAAAAAYNLPK